MSVQKSQSIVSFIIPCYNGANFIFRLLDSLLRQTYDRMEIFVIDDGSTDESAAVIKSYISKFEEKQIKLDYIYQENAGQSYAINRGLKLFSGDYLAWL